MDPTKKTMFEDRDGNNKIKQQVQTIFYLFMLLELSDIENNEKKNHKYWYRKDIDNDKSASKKNNYSKLADDFANLTNWLYC